MSRKITSIPEPQPTVTSMHETVLALKQVAEALAGQRGPTVTRAVTFQDLIDLGLITPGQVPR